VLRFEDVRVWQSARGLARDTYAITRLEAFARDHALSTQMRRSAVSVMANIAEGFERRRSAAEFARFLNIAKGSCGELRSHLYVASDQQYITVADLQRLSRDATHVSCMLAALIRSLRR
jgi:four helix bundle protein